MRLTKFKIQRMIKMFEEGLPTVIIAVRLGATHSGVSWWRAKWRRGELRQASFDFLTMGVSAIQV